MTEQSQTVRFLLGKRPRDDTLFPRLFADLAARGIGAEVMLPHETNRIGSTRRPTVTVQRGLRRAILTRLAQLESDGWRFCNPVSASLAAQDRVEVMATLRSAGLPVPDGMPLNDWAAGRDSGRHAVVVKAADGRIGRGAGVVFVEPGSWPAEPPFPGPWIVEQGIAGDGVDRKLYVAGRACRGLLKPWPRHGALVRPFDPDAELVHIARAAGRALNLEIYGVDAVLGPRGPVIVDVNVFPGFRGVERAETLIADHLAELLADRQRDCVQEAET
jgi:ribosomal protein S6--L-glutamate ligase